MSNYRILLVDDEKNLTQCLEMVLSIEGHTVITANSGEKALELIKGIYKGGEKIDLLITDIWMQGMSGLELIKSMHEQKIAPLTIGISGFTDDKTADELYRKGCNDLILKPFTPDELLHRISENMNGHKHIADKTH
jgi:DNA-binding NtrC family response regulator